MKPVTVKLPRPRPLRGCFVTGTGTGVGKTVVAAALVAVLRARAIRVAVQKPVITGLDEPASADWPHDHQLLAQAAGVKADQVVAARFGPAVSPHLAARLSGAAIDAGALVAGIRDAAGQAELVVVEGVGGLMVPLTESYDVRCLARDLGLPLVVAAPPGLGTINHTLLTLAAAREAGLTVLGVVLTPWPRAPRRSSAPTRKRSRGLARLRSPPCRRWPGPLHSCWQARGAACR